MCGRTEQRFPILSRAEIHPRAEMSRWARRCEASGEPWGSLGAHEALGRRNPPASRCTRAPDLSDRSENLGGAHQRLPHAPAERDADERPERDGLQVEPAFADP